MQCRELIIILESRDHIFNRFARTPTSHRCARSHVSFSSIKRSSYDNISRLPTRVPLRRRGVRRGTARAKVAGSTRSPRSSRRLPQVHPLGQPQFPFALARNGRNIVRLCLHLIHRQTGYTEPCLWPVSHVHPAAGGRYRPCKRRILDRVPRIFRDKRRVVA